MHNKNLTEPIPKKRRSIRLQDYDYAQGGAYFVTICTFGKLCLLGEIAEGDMKLNDFGNIVRPNVELDEFVVMPNHFHGIIEISYSMKPDGKHVARKSESGVCNTPLQGNSAMRSPAQTIGAIIRGFKAAVTKRIKGNRMDSRQPFWQRNYFEHVIRNDKDLDRILVYIQNNPIQWHLDEENPTVIKK